MAKNNELVKIKLPSNDVGQIIDALCIRRSDWRYTQRYLEEGYQEDDRIIEECNNACEAKNLADYYDDIIKRVQSQLH